MVTDKYNMDGHKLRWHLDRVKQWSGGEKIAPLHADTGITTGCNLACEYCYGVLQGRSGYGTSYKKRFDMSKEAVTKLVKDAKKIGFKSMAFIGEGENTLNPALYDAFETAKSVGLDISLGTNAIKIKPDKLDIMLDSLTWLRVNISAATPKSYARIHQTTPETFKRVIKNIDRLVEAKRKGKYKTAIGLQMVITKNNMDQVAPLARLGKELGADYSIFKPCSDTSDKRLDSPDREYLDMEPVFRKAESYNSDNYSVVIKRIKLQNLGLKNYERCYGTQFIIAISGNGNVFPCGHWFNFRKDEFLMGNVINDSLENIVKSERYWDVQNKVSEIVNVNRDCETNCRQHYINQFLWDLKTGKIKLEDIKPRSGEKTSEHINFI
jgi:radical SAM protein with 4Fe4S-binding SPASM domain